MKKEMRLFMAGLVATFGMPILPQDKAHLSKEKQSQKDREYMLEKARLKRERKSARKEHK